MIFRNLLHLLLPKNRFGDKIYSFINFFVNHKRFPTEKKLFNDYFYKIKTTNEILDPLRIFLSDKEYVKMYVKSQIGEEYNVPTLKILRSFKEAQDFEFPHRCVIKPTHMSGEVIIRKDNETIDYDLVKRWFLSNYYNRSREANYKMLKPKVIVEELLFNDENIKDYKFFCYKGETKIISVDIDRFTNNGKDHKRKYLNCSWEDLNFSILYERYEKDIEKPLNLNMMIEQVNKLASSTNLNLIRVDAYSNNKNFYIGEMTNIHGNCSEHFFPKDSEEKASNFIFK